MREEQVSYLERTDTNFMSLRMLDSEIGKNEKVTVIEIESQRGIVEARQAGRIMAQGLGCSATQATLVATVISELSRNIILYAGCGKLTLCNVSDEGKTGMQIIANDKGPGIPNVARAMMNGFSTSGGLGLGLAGVRQIADNFLIKSKAGQGVEVDVVMWFSEK
jgi:serine/threonine-protein kinase RsbT